MHILQLLIILVLSKYAHAHDIQFNNGSEQDYSRAASLSGDVREIQSQTKGLWPRAEQGTAYSVGKNNVTITENDKFLIFTTNNLPDHELTTTNPNCATEQSFKFLIPKSPKELTSPKNITKNMQEIGVALNGVVIAGPYDSQDKIAPYNRVVDQCASHADPQGMYHYHFAPLCMKDSKGREIAIDETKQIGWSFDGFSIKGLANRETHLPQIDTCNGHEHDGEYHYHVTRDFPFFMGCYRAKPQSSNFTQKPRGKGTASSSCPRGMSDREVKQSGPLNSNRGAGPHGGKKRPNFQHASSILNISERELKKALGPPPGNFPKAAQKLGISEQQLREALQVN